MSQPEKQEELIEKIENLKDFELWKIRDETASFIFQDIWYDTSKLKEFADKFDNIYYLAVRPTEIEKHKNNPTIYEILKRYEHTAERRKLEIMIFKIKEVSEEERQKILEKLKEEYWDMVKLDETKYWYIVWYFGWTAWRTNSYYMDEIKKIYPVKQLK